MCAISMPIIALDKVPHVLRTLQSLGVGGQESWLLGSGAVDSLVPVGMQGLVC